MSKIDFDTFGKTRAYKLLLFADNRDHMRVLNKLKRLYASNYIGIWHTEARLGTQTLDKILPGNRIIKDKHHMSMLLS